MQVKRTYKVLGLLVFLALFLGSCAPKACPANAKEVHHRQLVKINKKRKVDRGLFPKSMKDFKPKKTRKKKEPAPEEVDEDL